MPLLLAVAPGCQGDGNARTDSAKAASSGQPQPLADAYARDIDRICNAESRSGARELPEDQRGVIVAQWLGAEIETGEGRSFLVTLRQASPADKPALLERAARERGVVRCELADTWRAHAGATGAEAPGEGAAPAP